MAEKVVNLRKKVYEKLFLKGEKKFRKCSIVNSYFGGIDSVPFMRASYIVFVTS